ncbi:hypothetical protein ASG39_15840 [Rhizobium sp. Leaf371]|nr:hypothetical protein ASG39_15840 [Rhizobium sp. Leaf371]
MRVIQLFSERIGHQRIGVTMAEAVLKLEPSDQFHVLLPALSADQAFPLRDRSSIFGFDRRKIRRRPLYRICRHGNSQTMIASDDHNITKVRRVTHVPAAQNR